MPSPWPRFPKHGDELAARVDRRFVYLVLQLEIEHPVGRGKKKEKRRNAMPSTSAETLHLRRTTSSLTGQGGFTHAAYSTDMPSEALARFSFQMLHVGPCVIVGRRTSMPRTGR